MLAGRYAWSGFLGCFVGELGGGARGVPERFLAPNAAPPTEILAPTPTPALTPALGAVKAEDGGFEAVGGGGGGSNDSPSVESPAPSGAGINGTAAAAPAGQGG